MFSALAAVGLHRSLYRPAGMSGVGFSSMDSVGNGFVENFQSLTEGSHNVHLCASFKIRNAGPEML